MSLAEVATSLYSGPVSYAEQLNALAEELRSLAVLPPEQVVAVLASWVDRKSADSAEKRLAGIRQAAAIEAVAVLGSQKALALELGLGEAAVSRIVTGARAR